ncbi:hypothetical protein K505DRAFT_132763 [Melanomma pulvis-pyrius CBS 109.77]|uniref:Uncharacterized protein n=1 Tax=Melanomma pulvis-pyrius CBS 109.77 TaxID=1314802 RepID=A0A6A6WT42_9PLEO|nr:hypothetical protein K505DRAFT_132763 [Melanomma pulvis-pyrius CBS 109.77]
MFRLLSLRGNLSDKRQGVYADVITNSEPFYARIYVGSAAGVYKGRKDSGLCRRIKEHMASLKKGSRSESGMLHAKELKKANAQANFTILVRFAEEVDLPTVRIAEALMTILFCAWDSQTFHSLRPKSLAPIPRCFGLNNANPLTVYAFAFAITVIDLSPVSPSSRFRRPQYPQPTMRQYSHTMLPD